MKTYTEPKLDCRLFEAENIVTSSGETPTQDKSAAQVATEQMTGQGVAESRIVTATWSAN